MEGERKGRKEGRERGEEGKWSEEEIKKKRITLEIMTSSLFRISK